MFASYVAVGDSFTEGVGDELPSGGVRGWADFVALGLASAQSVPVRYANLAIRGRKLGPLIAEQLHPAIELRPDLISINGGGNDILRPRVSIRAIADQLDAAVDGIVAAGIHALVLSGANPSRHLPLGGVMRARGEELATIVRARYPREHVTFVDNWADASLEDIRYWSPDRLHLNGYGHARVASNVLNAFDLPVPEAWSIDEVAEQSGAPGARRSASYYRRYVLPWIGRRLTGRSSGDGRSAKYPALTVVDPSAFGG